MAFENNKLALDMEQNKTDFLWSANFCEDSW